MELATTATRLWKHLPPEERQQAAAAFWKEPPREAVGSALAAVVKARHLRPQTARRLAPEAQARILATVLDPGEDVAAGLLVALHLAERRPLLTAFLDALELPHEDGVLKEEEGDAPPPVAESAARRGIDVLLRDFPRPQVTTYLNTLWLQDPDRWSALKALAESL